MCEEYTGPDAVVDPEAPDPQLRQLAEENKKLREQIQQMRATAAAKKKVEFSKLIFLGVSIATIAITVFSCRMIWITMDTSVLAYLIPAVFAEMASATGFYYTKAKAENNETASKYIDLATDAVEQAVTYTAQTFVDALKAEGAFTKEKQLEAFQKARDKVLEILGDTTVKALGEIYGDFDAWLDTKIEQVCRDIKVPEVEKAATTTAAATAASVASTIATTAVQQIAAEAAPANDPVETEEKTE